MDDDKMSPDEVASSEAAMWVGRLSEMCLGSVRGWNTSCKADKKITLDDGRILTVKVTAFLSADAMAT